MVKQDLLQSIKQRLAEHYGDRLKGVVLFGSEARGDADEDSDVDLLVLLDGPVETWREIRAILDQIYPLQLARGFYRHLSAIPVNAEEYASRSDRLFRSAQEEGITL